MSGAYVRAIQDALAGFLNLIVRLALPLSILLGLALIAIVIGYFQNRESTNQSLPLLRKGVSKLTGMALVGITFLVCWAALKQTRPVAVEAMRWRDAAEAVVNPTSDAPAVYQSGPIAAAIRERTFVKNINLPPEIGKRLETEGVQALAPYLPESSATNVLDQTDKLEKRGNLYFLTRQVKRMEENPVPFQKSEITADFKQIGDRAYDVGFEGSYTFKNPSEEAANIRFSFPLPQSGTISGLTIQVDSDKISQPGESGNYEWSGTLAPGASKTAKVTYRVVGAKLWKYDVGSQRRVVEQFSLNVRPNGPVKFMRGSLQPTTGGANPTWNLANVVTNQRVAVSFPSDTVARETFVQTLAMLPAGLAVFLFGSWLVIGTSKERKEPIQIALALALFAFGLGGSVVLASYLGPLLGVIVSLVAGCLSVPFVLGPRSLMASIPSAAFAAAFLSAEHTGIIVATVLVAFIIANALAMRNAPSSLAT
ncbi:MAG: hypothetical protein H7Y17_16435 [Chlorobia bacterium]|nr:hypothetical protein [Fimbriimonadaceae bacterium]